MNKINLIGPQTLSDNESDDDDVGFQPLAMKKNSKGETTVESASTSSPESMKSITSADMNEISTESTPYPYFYHTWPTVLFEKPNDVKEIFHIDVPPDQDKKSNIFIWNNQLKNSPDENCSNFFDEHNKYGNSLQNYYTVINQSGNLTENWRSNDRINIVDITPVYVQKCENIMSTLLFMPLDQCHDFRGGRTANSSSWVTTTQKDVLKTNVNQVDIQRGITSNIYTNGFMNTLVNTSFSGLKNIVGILVISDYSLKILEQSTFFVNGNIDFQNIMNQFGISFAVGSDIFMFCNPAGNRTEITVNGRIARILFLGFTSDGWDKGMHNVWSMNEKKHIYSIKIDRINKSSTSSDINVVYSGNKITTFENIVPCYEVIYKNMDKTGFVNTYEINGQKINSRNLNSLFDEENFNNFYASLLSELYRKKDEIIVEESDDSEITGGVGPDDPIVESDSSQDTYEGITSTESSQTNDDSISIPEATIPEATKLKQDISSDFLYRGATYRFYGVRAPDSKLMQRLSAVEAELNKSYENIFIEVLKKISKNIQPQIHSSFTYPELTDISINGDSSTTEQLNDRINAVNTLFENSNSNMMSQYPTLYDKKKYDELVKLDNNCEENSNGEKFIMKQFGTVNDMNIAPTIDRVMNSLNCSNNCEIINTNEEDTEESNATDINNLYPYRFQLVSGVLDSSLQGGENMPEYFPPEIDIFMTIFDNQGQLQGIIVRMTFLEYVLRNSANIKNSAKVYSHFTYIGFDEIDLKPISSQLEENWKLNYEKYPLALKQLLDYVTKNTAFVLSRSSNIVTKFNTLLNDGNYRNWYYYFSDNVGPSVSEGINNVVIRIFSGTLEVVKDDNIQVGETIVKVAQKIYNECSTLKSIFTPSNPRTLSSSSIDRSYEFESIFLLRIKYIGDKSRCTDSLFLNRNKFAECMQITGDENAYFTALINGASTIFSPPSKFALYFAPYFTYGDVNSEGKFLLNLPIYKQTLLTGESPSGFKIKTGKSRSRNDDSSRLLIESPLISGPGNNLLNETKNLISKINRIVKCSYDNYESFSEKAYMSYTNETDQNTINKNRKNALDKALRNIDTYDGSYKDMVHKHGILLSMKKCLDIALSNAIESLTQNGLFYVNEYYSNLLKQLNEVFTDNDYIVRPVELSKDDYTYIKEFIMSILNNQISEIETIQQNVSTQSGMGKVFFNKLPDIIAKYKQMLNKFTVLEDQSELVGLLIELTDYHKTILKPIGMVPPVLWDNRITLIYEFVSSLKDMNTYILPTLKNYIKLYGEQVINYNSSNIDTRKNSFTQAGKRIKSGETDPVLSSDDLDRLGAESASKPDPTVVIKPAEKTRRFNVDVPVSIYDSDEEDNERKNIYRETPTTTASAANVESVSITKPAAKKTSTKNKILQSDQPPVVNTTTTTTRSGRVSKQKSLSGGGKVDEESYRKNQIYILKCFSDIIRSNDTKFQNLITPDKSNIEYSNIDNIDKYCVSLLMLQTYNYFKGYQPKLESTQNIISAISTLNEENTSLNEAIGIRNHYAPIINNYVEIEYLQMSAADYVLGMNDYELLDQENVMYELFNGCQISYYILEFIMSSLMSVNTLQNKLLNNTTSKNYGVISQIFDIINNFDIDVMYGFYELDENKQYINSSSKFSSEEKSYCNEQILTVNNYEYLCLFFIKYCNEFFMSLTGNKLNYSTDGLIYNYSSLLDGLKNDGFNDMVVKFNGININLNQNTQDIILKLVNLKMTEDMNAYLQNAIDIVSPIGSMTSQTNSAVNTSSEPRVILHYVNPKSLQNQSQSFVTVKSYTAGTFKNKKNKKNKKSNTKTNKAKKSKGTIKNKKKIVTKYTRKHT